MSSVSDIFFVFSDRDFVKFRGIATQRLTVTKTSEQTLAGLQWNDELLSIVRRRGIDNKVSTKSSELLNIKFSYLTTM